MIAPGSSSDIPAIAAVMTAPAAARAFDVCRKGLGNTATLSFSQRESGASMSAVHAWADRLR
jgi:hypothetical protein